MTGNCDTSCISHLICQLYYIPCCMNARYAFCLVVYYYDKLNLCFSIKRVRYQNTTKESVSVLVDIASRYLFSFALNFFRLAAVDSKTSSRARDRKGVYTQKSKMAAQNGIPNNEFQPSLSQKLAISEPSFCK